MEHPVYIQRCSMTILFYCLVDDLILFSTDLLDSHVASVFNVERFTISKTCTLYYKSTMLKRCIKADVNQSINLYSSNIAVKLDKLWYGNYNTNGTGLL